MSVDPEDQFIEFLKSTLEKNGYPEKKVSLPLAKVQSAAEGKGLELDMILSRLKMGSVYSELTAEKIIFSDTEAEEPQADTANPFASMPGGMDGLGDMLGGMDLGALQNMSQEELMGQVSNLMGNMTPEQQESMMEMYQNMPDKDKEDIMNKGKDMGLL